jgi:hypothetical protein
MAGFAVAITCCGVMRGGCADAIVVKQTNAIQQTNVRNVVSTLTI